jgi:hypothetical protein
MSFRRIILVLAVSACGPENFADVSEFDGAEVTEEGALAAQPVKSTSLSEKLKNDRFESPIWTDGRFDGSVVRSFGGNWLWVSVAQRSEGGMDTGVGVESARATVDQVPSTEMVSAKLRIDGKTGAGSWWYGPKISVNWSTSGWYENYIVESASTTPAAFDAQLKAGYSPGKPGKYLGETTHDGGTYKHYLVEFNGWHQFWAIRQSYRREGSTSVGLILRHWRNNGLPNKRMDGIKYNLETHKPMTLKFLISHVRIGVQ